MATPAAQKIEFGNHTFAILPAGETKETTLSWAKASKQKLQKSLKSTCIVPKCRFVQQANLSWKNTYERPNFKHLQCKWFSIAASPHLLSLSRVKRKAALLQKCMWQAGFGPIENLHLASAFEVCVACLSILNCSWISANCSVCLFNDVQLRWNVRSRLSRSILHEWSHHLVLLLTTWARLLPISAIAHKLRVFGCFCFSQLLHWQACSQTAAISQGVMTRSGSEVSRLFGERQVCTAMRREFLGDAAQTWWQPSDGGYTMIYFYF